MWSCDAATSPLPSSAAEQTSYLSRFDIQHQSEFELAQKHLTSIEKWIKIECLNHRFLDFKFLSSSSEETCQKDSVRKITFARQERSLGPEDLRKDGKANVCYKLFNFVSI